MADSFRALVEPLKFLDVGTLLLNVALVSHQWKDTMDSTEVWNIIISEMLGCQIVLKPSQANVGSKAFRTYLDEVYRYMLLVFNDEDRLLEHARIEEARRRNRVYTRGSTELKMVRVPRMTKNAVKLPKEYIHAFHSAYIWVPPFHLFICGGRVVDDHSRLTSPTYLLNLHNFSIECLEETILVNSPSLVQYQEVVFWFGGSVFAGQEPATCLNTARKFSLSDRRWTPLQGGNMPNPHCYGWAERYQAKIFIIGGFGSSGAVDVFDIPSETFRTLAVSLSSKSEALIGIRDGDTLHCLSGQKAMTVRLSDWATDTVSEVIETQLHSDNVWMWASPVIVCEKKAYFVLFDTVVYTYELETKKFEFEKNDDN